MFRSDGADSSPDRVQDRGRPGYRTHGRRRPGSYPRATAAGNRRGSRRSTVPLPGTSIAGTSMVTGSLMAMPLAPASPFGSNSAHGSTAYTSYVPAGRASRYSSQGVTPSVVHSPHAVVPSASATRSRDAPATGQAVPALVPAPADVDHQAVLCEDELRVTAVEIPFGVGPRDPDGRLQIVVGGPFAIVHTFHELDVAGAAPGARRPTSTSGPSPPYRSGTARSCPCQPAGTQPATGTPDTPGLGVAGGTGSDRSRSGPHSAAMPADPPAPAWPRRGRRPSRPDGGAPNPTRRRAVPRTRSPSPARSSRRATLRSSSIAFDRCRLMVPGLVPSVCAICGTVMSSKNRSTTDLPLPRGEPGERHADVDPCRRDALRRGCEGVVGEQVLDARPAALPPVAVQVDRQDRPAHVRLRVGQPWLGLVQVACPFRRRRRPVSAGRRRRENTFTSASCTRSSARGRSRVSVYA